jgi:hypothetical protein
MEGEGERRVLLLHSTKMVIAPFEFHQYYYKRIICGEFAGDLWWLVAKNLAHIERIILTSQFY